MNTIGIIPARMAASRFPNKPLAPILGIPMLGHVYFRSKMNKSLREVYIATCDEEIKSYAKTIGAQCIMTKSTHQRASDRTAEAMLKIENLRKKRVDLVVMIQGDEPMLTPQMIDAALRPFGQDKIIQVVNLMAPLEDQEEHRNINEIKVVVDRNQFALYFSRRAIPFVRADAQAHPKFFKQVCIIPFRRDFLMKFNRLPSLPLEIAESVDMLRVLEHGFKVKMVLSPQMTFSVDTLDELKVVEKWMAQDPLIKRYERK